MNWLVWKVSMRELMDNYVIEHIPKALANGDRYPLTTLPASWRGDCSPSINRP